MKWRTFDGRIADTETAPHQHMSNFVHYHRIIGMGEAYVSEHVEAIQTRFNGELLPYEPPGDFKAEIYFLVREGYIKINPSSDWAYISKDGKIWGGMSRLKLEGILPPGAASSKTDEMERV